MNNLDVALQYAAEGWFIVPLHAPTGNPDQPCSCRRANCPDAGKHPCHKNTCKEQGKHPCHQSVCESVGKHPRTQHGVDDATTDESKIRDWWKMWPDSNIGAAMGAKAGRFTLDVDPRNGGADTLATLTAQYGDLPPTRTALTGGIGHHYIFMWPAGYTGKLRGSLGPGLDVKGEGGLIVLAPSLHVSGNFYRWLNDAPVAEAPAWMLDKLCEAKLGAGASAEVGETIPEGARNKTLTSLGGTMRRRGMGAEEIEAALLVTNERRCKPPLAADEVRKIALSVSKYPAADAKNCDEDPPAWWDSEPGSSSSSEGPKKDDGKEPNKLAVSWADFDAEQFIQGERVGFAVERGEIALLNALPNAGKTTLALNVVVSLAAGLSLYPVVDRGMPRRVLYIDGETRRARLQRDLRTMTKGFDRETAMRVGQNLHVVCEAEINSESLALTRTDHLLLIFRYPCRGV